MPKGKWQPPESGDAPAEVKHILKVAYSQYRDKHPSENPGTKMKGAKIAWGAVHAAGWSKNKSGKWVKKGASEMSEFIEKKEDVNPESGKEKYGDVKFADPKNKKYPIDTEEHIRAAWNYINKSGNADKYSAEDVKTIKAHIVSAWKEKIDKAGPPSAKEMSEEIVIDAFKAGKYPQGTFTVKELAEIASTYDPNNYEAPILIGHLSDPSYKGKSAIPAYGWIGKAKVVGNNLKLVASQFSEELKNFVKQGFYKKVSAAFFQPDDPNNPTPGKWHLHHLAFLGGTPPAVKGLEQIQFAEYTLKAVGVEFAEMDMNMEIDGTAIDTAEELGTQDTLDDMAEYCANFMKKVEDALSSDIDIATAKSRINLAAFDLNSELTACIQMHFSFIEKLENLEEHAEGEHTELSEKKSWIIKFTELITKNKKESDMDAQEKKKYEEKIAQLEAKIKELEDKDAEEEKKEKETEMQETVKQFCESAIKEGRMTPAQREKDEPIMLTLAKSAPEALVSFQEKYSKPAVPQGEAKLGDLPGNKKPETILDKAASYVKTHGSDKEFSDCQTDDAKVSRAIFLESTGKIKF